VLFVIIQNLRSDRKKTAQEKKNIVWPRAPRHGVCLRSGALAPPRLADQRSRAPVLLISLGRPVSRARRLGLVAFAPTGSSLWVSAPADLQVHPIDQRKRKKNRSLPRAPGVRATPSSSETAWDRSPLTRAVARAGPSAADRRQARLPPDSLRPPVTPRTGVRPLCLLPISAKREREKKPVELIAYDQTSEFLIDFRACDFNRRVFLPTGAPFLRVRCCATVF
jgi:hypothetical protein